jgi:recombinational DNA repair protein (RecF pathway)
MARVASKTLGLSAFVLGTRRFREQDRIVHLLALDYGRLDAVAYGASKPKSRFSGQLEPFTQLRILAVGKPESELWTIKEAESIELAPAVANRFGLHALLAVAELVIHAGPHHEMERETWPLLEIFRREIVPAGDPLGPLAAFVVHWSLRAGYGRPESSSPPAARFIRIASQEAFDAWHRFRITPKTRPSLLRALKSHVERCLDREWKGIRLFYAALPEESTSRRTDNPPSSDS